MNKWQAQDDFWNGFGLTAFDENTVLEDLTMPYITYEAVASGIGATNVVSASIWYRSRSWKDIDAKADEIAATINAMPPAIQIDGGWMKVRIPDNQPFAQRMEEPGDSNVRRILLNVEMEFLTAY